MRLLPGETIVGAASVSADGDVLLASRHGQIKRLQVKSLRLCERGDLGQIGLRFERRDDVLVDLQAATAAVVAAVMVGGRSLRLKVADLERQGSSGCGQPCALKPGEILQELVPLLESPA